MAKIALDADWKSRGYNTDENLDGEESANEASPLWKARTISDVRRKAPSYWAIAGICGGIALGATSVVYAAVGINAFLPHGEEDGSSVALEELVDKGFEGPPCPCACGGSNQDDLVVARPPTLPPPTPISPFAMLPTWPQGTTPPPPLPPSVPPAPQVPLELPAPATHPPTPLQPGGLNVASPPLQGILLPAKGTDDVHFGTVFIVKSATPIFEAFVSSRESGQLLAGDQVVASGPPQTLAGNTRLPIQPIGAVDMAALKLAGAPDPGWECHDWDMADKTQPGFNQAAYMQKICERNRGDGYQYNYTSGGSLVSGSTCSNCACCRHRVVPSVPSAGRRLTFGGLLGEDLIVQATTSQGVDLIVEPTTTSLQQQDLIVQPTSVASLPQPWVAPPQPVVPSMVFPWTQQHQKADSASEEQCRVGDSCAYGQAWCTKEGFQTLEPAGFCKKQECSGPDGIHSFPNHTCGRPALPQFNITSILSGLPGYVRELLADIPWLNKALADTLAWHKFHGLKVELDDVLTQSFEWRLSNSEVTWLVGCWPPQRYLVSDGEVNFRSGRIRVEVGGFKLIVSSYDLRASFKKFRADVECHGGSWYLGSVGKDAEGSPVTIDRVHTSGEMHVKCDDQISVLCFLLWLFDNHISAALVDYYFPEFLTWWLNYIEQLWVGPGCPGALHNTVVVMPYKSKECCEGSFRTDDFGCLVGGQFNGFRSSKKVFSGVKCKQSATDPDHFLAQCDTLPGTYAEQSPGVCREADNFADEDCSDCGDTWPPHLKGLQYLAWADTFLSFCIAWCTLVFCCLRCSPKEDRTVCSPRSRSRLSMEQRFATP